jgi:hypothetical protein
MVTVAINDKKYQVKTRWQEVEVEKLLQVHRDADGNVIPTTSKHELKALSNIPHEIIDKAEDLQLFPLYTLISFIHEAELLPIREALIVDKEQYRRFEAAKAALKVGKPYQKILSAAMVFYPEEKNPVQLVGLGLDIINQIALFLESYQEMVNAKPEGNEVEAGIEELGMFGFWGTAYVMAGRDLLKLDAIMSKPAIEVYTALFYSFKEAQYNKRKWELDHPPKPK